MTLRLTIVILSTLTSFNLGSGQLLTPDGSGVGSGSGDSDLVPFTCMNEDVDALQLEIFDVFSTELSQELGCSPTKTTEQLFYTVTLSHGEIIQLAEDRQTVDEYLGFGTYDGVSIDVCLLSRNSSGPRCDGSRNETQSFEDVTIVVGQNTRRLFPYGAGDSLVSNIDDVSVDVVENTGIPFLTDVYNRLHISSNGLVSFTSPYRAWWSTPIPFGRYLTPIIAPFWSDLDFRNGLPDAGLFYRVYRQGDADGNRRTELVLREFSSRLSSYTNSSDVDFEAEWLLVVTWKDASPWYGRNNNDEVVTFQLVLATDYLTTYAFFLYDEATWHLYRRFWPRIVIGHDAKDFTNYNNLQFDQNQFLRISQVEGNSGQDGEWYFNYTATGEIDSATLCRTWSQRQGNVSAKFDRSMSCPCTRRQAQRDWRFWFGYYWGLSPRSNCATLLFSRQQSTIECCYDTDGSLIVGANDGGSYLLHNPLFRYQQNVLEDRAPYRYCCEQSTLCQLYYKHRPSDDCRNYVNFRPPRVFGDPHFVSVDNNNFTFNGIGEYRLLESPSNRLSIQSRLEQFEDTGGTVITAIAIKQGDVEIQVEAKDNVLQLYVQGSPHPLPDESQVYMVTRNGVSSLLDDGIGIQNVASQDSLIQSSSNDQLSMQVDDAGTLIITTPGGATVMTALQMTFLQTTVVLTDSYTGETRGLMGVYNGEADDDFTLPNGTVLDRGLTEAQIYDFGLEWHVSETDSIFYYFNNASYSTYNSQYLSFVPTFTSELMAMANLPSDVGSVCQGNQACVYDYAISGNTELGNSTQLADMSGRELDSILNNRPPNITGRFVLYVEAGEPLSEIYNADDPDGDPVSTFNLKGRPRDFGITFTMLMTFMDGILEWANPGYDVPSEPIILFANDTKGASSMRRISIVLCGCQNSGSCVEADSDVENIQFDKNGHFKQICDCPDYYGGDSCEIDMRGCDYHVCPDSNVCQPNATEPSGYICTGCGDGYRVMESKCIDVDECLEMTDNCSQLQQCVNIGGSFLCECRAGYRSNDGGRTCEDIDECAEGTSGCSQLCTNTVGSYECSCHDGYNIHGDGSTCVISDNCGSSDTVCDDGTCTMIGGEYQCLCPMGQTCVGDCTGSDPSHLQLGGQLCQACTGLLYGYKCLETCDCMNGGQCNNTLGCVCADGWIGTNCNIEANRHAPVFDEVTPVMLNWTAVAGETVTRVSATDADQGPNAGNVTFALISPELSPPAGVSNGLRIFSINPNTGVITLAHNLLTHVREFSEILLTIEARDHGLLPLSATAVLSIVPVPVPYLRFNSRIVLREDVPEDTSLTEVQCREHGLPSNSLSLTLSGNYSRFFTVDIVTSQLSLVRKLDFELLPNRSDPFYRLDLICQNQFGLSDKRMIEIGVVNVDDNPLIFSRSFYSSSVLENAQVGSLVLQITASDADMPNATVNYAIVSLNRHFNIGPSNGIITVESQLDHEEEDSYSLTVRAELSGTSAEVMVNVSVLDVNDETPTFVRQPYIVNNITTMNEVGEHVVTVVATDRDLGENGRITYTLENNSFFAINKTTGDVYVNSVLPPNLDLTLEVYAMDGGDPELTATAVIFIFVQPSPEGVRFSQRNYNFVVQEDEPRGALIGRVEAFVVDGRNVTLNDSNTYGVSYSIVSGNGQSVFTIISTTGQMYLLSTLDFDLSARQYVLMVEATHQVDDNVLTDEVSVFVQVADVNDNPPQFMPAAYAIAIEEFTAANSTIITVMAMDIDSQSEIAYTILSDDSGPFEVHSSSGVISNREELLIARDYRFFVSASDGELSSMAVVFISVTRSVSVEPTFTRERYIFNLPESANRGSFVGTVEAVTRGSLSSLMFAHLQFRIVMPDQVAFNGTSQAGDSLFHVDPTSGNISTLTDFEFDAENRTTYIFFVQVYSTINDTVYDTTTVAVELSDANDNSPVFAQPLYTRVIENTLSAGSVILNISASDRDSTSNSEITYSIEPLSFNFTIDRMSGEVSIASSSLTTGNYRLTVVATDKGSPPLSGSATVVIAVIPAAPSNISFTMPVYYFSVSENAPATTLVGRVQALDAATNASLINVQYSTSNLSICLYVSPDDGEIRVSCNLDRETEPRYELQVMARDGEAVGYGTVVVDVLDVNDNRPLFSLDVYAELIDDQFGNETAILQVAANDADHGTNGSVRYTIVSAMAGMIDASTFFRINEVSGALYLREPSVPIGDYRLTIQASDSGEPAAMSSTALALICVVRARPSVFFFNTSAIFFIQENQPPLTAVGQAVLLTTGGEIDPSEFMDNLHFSIVGGDSDEGSNSSFPLFGIEADTGSIYTLWSLDRETADRHVIVIVANFTQFGLTERASLNIIVTDQNDERPRFQPMQYSSSIEENTENGTTVLNVTIVDEDIGVNAKIDLRLEGLDSTPFNIRVRGTSYPFTYGEIIVQDTDLLVPGQYDFEITALDRGTVSLSGNAQVYITVEHSPPDFISFQSDLYVFDFAENLPRRTFVGSVSIDQPITPALDSLVYSIEGGNGMGYFGIDGRTGNITTLRTIDRELDQQLNITVMAQVMAHPGLAPAVTTVVVNVEDINDNVPRFTLGLYAVSILNDEVSTGIRLVQVMVSDDDAGANAEFELSITEVTPLVNYFYITPDGDIFTNTTDLNVTTYHLTVVAMDMGNPPQSSSALVSISVELPVPMEIRFVQPEGYVFNISENLASGGDIGFIELESLPSHVLQFLTFTDNSSDFQIVRTSSAVRAEINALNLFDYERRQNYTLLVEARLDISSRIPPVNLATSVIVTILIIDENDNPPVFSNFPSALSFLENRTSEELIYHIQSRDADSGINGERRYAILNVDIRAMFRIDPRTGELYAAASLDREQRESYDITIQVSDLGTPSLSTQNTTRLTLLDINDNVPRMTRGFGLSIRERVRPPVQLAQLEGVDPDEGNNGTIDFFEVQTFNCSTTQSPRVPVVTIHTNGSVQLARELDYEEEESYTIHVRVSDRGSPRLEFTYTNVSLQVINEADNVPRFNASIYRNSTLPRLVGGDRLAQVYATDADTLDIITYGISSISVEGNGGVIPDFRIDARTGRIYANGNQNVTPEANFTIRVVAFDNSIFNLTDSTVVNIVVLPERLQFTQDTYTARPLENAAVSSRVIRVPLQPLSASSSVRYSIDVAHPIGQSNVFSISSDGQVEAVIRLARALDRETIENYTILVTAQRTGEQNITATVFVNVVDVNDNSPEFADAQNTVIEVSELTTSQLVITRVNVSDADTGENARLQYSFINQEALGYPFSINQDSGEISITGNLDYETRQSYTLRVRAQDSGNPSRRRSRLYIIQVINKNDNPPQFAAATYFGEVYAGAAVGENVLHTLVRVTDPDDETGDQEYSFRIYFPVDSDQPDAELYAFEVAEEEPYLIQVVRLPGDAISGPQLLELRLEASDGNLESTVVLYVSVFTSSNVIPFKLRGISVPDLLSCQSGTDPSSICGFRDALAQETRRYVGVSVQFYNISVQDSPDNPLDVDVIVYGWYGQFEPRDNFGELPPATQVNAIQYIDYNEDLFEAIVQSNIFNPLTFRVEFTPNVETTTSSTTSTTVEEPSVAGSGPPTAIILGVAVGGALAALVIILIIVLVVVFGRGKKKKTKKKSRRRARRSSDPYARSYDRHLDKPRPKPKSKKSRKDSERTMVSTTTTDQAYETMYDNEDILGTQTMPWFDPSYMAANPENASYDGDIDQPSSLQDRSLVERQGQSRLGLRATVDGDARRRRGYSSDEESVKELSSAQESHLKSYQQSTPMQPGQRMGEYDMFVQPREPDRPFRPSLPSQWAQRQHQQATSRF